MISDLKRKQNKCVRYPWIDITFFFFSRGRVDNMLRKPEKRHYKLLRVHKMRTIHEMKSMLHRLTSKNNTWQNLPKSPGFANYASPSVKRCSKQWTLIQSDVHQKTLEKKTITSMARAQRAPFRSCRKAPDGALVGLQKKSSDGSAGLDRASAIGWIGRLIPRKLKIDSSSNKQNWGFAVNFRKCRFQWTGHDGWLGWQVACFPFFEHAMNSHRSIWVLKVHDFVSFFKKQGLMGWLAIG